MTNNSVNKFYFCGQELPLYSDFWWAISRNLFNDYQELNYWEKQLSAYFHEIEWKLDKDRIPYSYDSNILSQTQEPNKTT